MHRLNMERKMKTQFLTLAAVVAATASFAQMADVDQDGDGMANYDEIVAVNPDVTEEQFAEIDTNGDGSLDETEMTAAVDAGQLVMPE